jgi:hypothetical protein
MSLKIFFFSTNKLKMKSALSDRLLIRVFFLRMSAGIRKRSKQFSLETEVLVNLNHEKREQKYSAIVFLYRGGSFSKNFHIHEHFCDRRKASVCCCDPTNQLLD